MWVTILSPDKCQTPPKGSHVLKVTVWTYRPVGSCPKNFVEPSLNVCAPVSTV